MFTCAECVQKPCRTHNTQALPKNCPCRLQDIETFHQLYTLEEIALSKEAALIEAEGYCRYNRLEEIMLFARRCGYEKLGLAFCVGLSSESKTVSAILRSNGFQVESIACKNGSIPKSNIGISDAQQVRPGQKEVICNPIGQAHFLKQAETQFNILLGLCVGHDTLFLKHSEAPTTILAVKDRVTCHNPLASVYTADSYTKGMYHFMDSHS